MTNKLLFKNNQELTMGVELELQLVNLENFNLEMEAEDFLRRIEQNIHPGEIKPEITQSMIEINSSIHHDYKSLAKELFSIRNTLVKEAEQTNIGVCGGGSHHFQKWRKQRIFQTERFEDLSTQYGYLAKQFTIFGQHIHIACKSGDDALYLCHALAHYIPHFIALSASSPFNQSVDTGFDCSRLAVISAFPLSGTPPWLFSWDEFNNYFDNMVNLKIVKSMKDFYWDIRPKPEYGTIELRICDTPLTVERAAVLASYLQTLVSYLLDTKPKLNRDMYITYLINRFRACRYGLEAVLIDPVEKSSASITDDILKTIDKIHIHGNKLNCSEALESIVSITKSKTNDASWLRNQLNNKNTLNDLTRLQVELWKK